MQPPKKQITKIETPIERNVRVAKQVKDYDALEKRITAKEEKATTNNYSTERMKKVIGEYKRGGTVKSKSKIKVKSKTKTKKK